MTNETTASQPMQELVRDLYNFEGGRHFALRLEKLIASQPKSIGDDAQFFSWLDRLGDCGNREQFKQVSADFIAYIHEFFRAPADQASATIQVAPDLTNLLRVDFYPDTGEYESSADGKYVKFADVEALLAATIQEPVIVAEPVQVVVSLGDTWADSCIVCQQRGEFGIATQKGPDGCREAVESGEIYCAEHIGDAIKPTLAAPMVADPAGVALCKSCEGSGEVTGMVGSGPDGWEETRNCPDCGGTGDLAATVKAVPSEALALAFSREDWGIIFDGVMLEIERSQKRKEANTASNSDERVEQGKSILAAICKVCAAPLADKTGGGD